MVLGMTPTSRGSVTLASADPTANHVIDPNYYATEADRVAICTGVRRVLASTPSTFVGKSLIEAELTEHVGDTDEAIDARVEEYGAGLYHPAGTCAMGKVVDGACRVGCRGGWIESCGCEYHPDAT
jgi:choline dehydrogenase-like flavoprotein